MAHLDPRPGIPGRVLRPLSIFSIRRADEAIAALIVKLA